MISLRPYQQNLISDIRSGLIQGHNRIVTQSPTGSGKTVIFSFIIKNASEKGNRCAIASNRVELLEQTGGTFERIGLSFDNLTSKTKVTPRGLVIISMVETLKRRLKKRLDFQMWAKSINILIIDEVHLNCFNELFQYLSETCIVLGFSATPYRTGKMPELSQFFTQLVNGPGIENLILSGFLSKPKYYGVPVNLQGVKTKAGEFDDMDLQKIYTSSRVFIGLKENIEKHTRGLKTIIFCPTIETSKQVAFELGCLHVDGEMSPAERDAVLTKFESDPHGIITNVGILTTGYDCPAVECIILYRATKSLPLFLQMCGRGSRTTETKKEFTILDFGNNIARFGFWHDERKWSLDNKKSRNRNKEDAYPVKSCPQCGALVAVNTKTCEFCGYVWEKTEKERVFAELQELSYGEIVSKIRKGMPVSELEEIRVAKNYKIGFVLHQFTTPEQFIEYGKLKGYHPNWARIQSEKYLTKDLVI